MNGIRLQRGGWTSVKTGMLPHLKSPIPQFGYIKEGTTNVKNHLPVVKSFKEWNSFDAESGVKSFILNGMEDLKLQLYQDISNFFNADQFYDAKVLANDMHSKSQIFIAEMSN